MADTSRSNSFFPTYTHYLTSHGAHNGTLNRLNTRSTQLHESRLGQRARRKRYTEHTCVVPVLAVPVLLGGDALERPTQKILNDKTSRDVPLLVYSWDIRPRVSHLDGMATTAICLGPEKRVTRSKN